MTLPISSPLSTTIAPQPLPNSSQNPRAEACVGIDNPKGSANRRKMNNLTTGSGKVNANISGSSGPTPSMLRRKVSVEDSLRNVASIQRLVEYFVTVSCHPRLAPPGTGVSSGIPSTPQSINAIANKRREMEAPNPSITTEDSMDGTSSSRSSKPRFDEKIKGIFRISKTSTEHGLEASLSREEGSEMDETRQEPHTLPPPKPRGTWKRDKQGANDGNIHMPGDDTYDEYNFQPTITSRYPLSDHEDNPLNPMVTHFCHPVGDVVFPSREYHMPRVHYFVLTNDKGRKIYGTCLTVYEEYEPPSDAPLQAHHLVHCDSGERDIEITVDNAKTTLYLPRCLCLLSMWPHLTAFREYLAQIYRLATSTDCMKVPLERYIVNICMEIPAPPPGAFEVQISIFESVIRFWSPPAKLPIAYVSLPYQVLFDCLDLDNIMHLWYCLAMEHKVLLVSSQYSNLTVCSEILCSLLYPMKWSHLYVPLLPRFLCPMLDAPGKWNHVSHCSKSRQRSCCSSLFCMFSTLSLWCDQGQLAFRATVCQ